VIVALGITAIVGFTLPHGLRLRRTPPATALVIWICAGATAVRCTTP
jgi:hypothetical protein